MPRSLCMKRVSCIHLRSVWQVLTVLTVVCVALQLLGVVRQARNTKIIGPADEQLGIKHLPAVQRNGGVRRSIPTTLNPNQRDYQLFKWGDTTPARHLTTTLKQILLPHGHQLASKATPLPADTKDEPWVYPEIFKQSLAQNKNWGKNIPRTYSELPSEDSDPEIYPGSEEPTQSPAQRRVPGNLPRKYPVVLSKDKTMTIYQKVVKQPPAQKRVLETLAKKEPEVPLKDKPGIYQQVVKQRPAQNEEPGSLPKKDPEVPLKENPRSIYRQVVKPTPANNVKLNNLLIKPYKVLSKEVSNVLSRDNNGKCRPKNHIVFLKTHKTASSTILNILYRYGDTRNLTFALPVNMHSQLYYPNFFLAYFVEGLRFSRVRQFHIMCNHMRFRGPEVRKVMPVDTFYFSILRDPVFMMESLFSYYKGIPAFHNYRTLTEFLLDGGRSYNASVFNNHYARNVLTFDFGLNNVPPANKLELDKRSAELIAEVESNFHLILISEYFDESMILLKHSLCWTLEDVVSFRLNSRNAKSRSQLSPLLHEHIKQWNSLDWRLYQHFNATFWRRIDTVVGREKLQEEVELLRTRRAKLERTCLLGGGAVDPEKVQDLSLKPFQYGQAVIQGYNIRPGLDSETHQLCQRLITPELQYTKTLYAKQFPDLVAQHEADAKASAAQHLASAKRAMATTRHSAGTKSALENNSVQVKTQEVKKTVQKTTLRSNTNVHQREPDSVHYAKMKMLEKDSTIIKDNANKVGKETQPNSGKHRAIEHKVPSLT